MILTFQSSDALFKRVVGGVTDATVDVTLVGVALGRDAFNVLDRRYTCQFCEL